MAQVKIQLGSKEYNKAWIDNLSSTTQISSDASTINYGVLPNTGNAQMKDINGQIKADIDNDILPVSNVQTKITVNGNQIQEHITSNSDYNIIDKKLDLSFSDRLSLLDSVTYQGMSLKEYSMTAYEMLDDVIGSYGGYAKERPINWVKYQHAGSIETQSKSTTITATTGYGWEIIGTPLKVVPNKKCSLSYSISTDTAYTELMGQGIIVQILNSEPTDSDCASLAIAYAFLSKEVADNIGIIEFTPTTDTVYFVINFGWASSDQTISLTVNSLKVDGNSLSTSTMNDKFLEPSASATYTNYSIKSTTSTIGDYLDEITIDYPYLPSASYRETIEKFCNFAQITCALENDGTLQFYDARPCYRHEDVIDVPKSYQISNLQKTLLLKNKYNGVDIKQNKVNEKILTDTAVYNMNILPTDYSTNPINDSNSNSSGTRSVIFETYYTTFSPTIPKNAVGLKNIIKKILTGKKDSDNGYVYYDVKWKYQFYQHEMNINSEWVDTLLYETTDIGDIVKAQFATDGKVDALPNPFAGFKYEGEIGSIHTVPTGLDIQYSYVETGTRKVISTSCADKSSTLVDDIFHTDENGDFIATIDLLVGKKATVFPTLSTLGYYGIFIPQSVNIQFNGNVYTIDFEEVDLSSSNIANATTIASVPTNELMQKSENVIGIRDNILYDYEKGVPTATIDLFCGLKDWGNGEIINKGDIIKFADDIDKNGDENLWRVTGRTFEYKGAPKLSLELQRQKCWHTIWTGSAKAENISNGDFTTSGIKTGAISLPISVDTSLTTAFVANVTFVRDGNTVVRTACGITNATASILLTGTITSIICDLSINKDGNQISYSADEVYKKVLTTVHKGYVKSIYINRIEQFY